MPLMFDFNSILSGVDFTHIVIYFVGIVIFWAMLVVLIMLLLKGGE